MSNQTETVTVARGRSIQVGDRIYLPGEQAPIPAEDVAHMRAGGFIHDPEAVVVLRTAPRQENNPAAIGLQKTENSA